MRFACCLPAILLAVAGSARATVINVPADHLTIQGGIDAAGVGDTVFVAAGTFDDLHYPPSADTTRCVVFMKTGVTLRGSGRGQTIIDALGAGRGIYCEGVANGRIESLTVTNAFAQNHAAGLYCFQGSSPTVTDCEFVACNDGGVIIRNDSHPDISDCRLSGNDSKQGGGLAIENNCSPMLTNCEIVGNSAPLAGGVYIKNGSAPVFEHCVIDSNSLNTVNGKGGGVGVSSSLITLRNCSVSHNVSTGPGGGFHLEDGTTAVIESTLVMNNSTPAGTYGPGGGIYCELSDMDIDDCTIAGNRAPDGSSDGGGVFIFFTTTTTITRTTIADNETAANLGGGISCFAFASPVIESSIIAFNGPGVGLYCGDPSSVPVVLCSDVYGNEDGDGICGVDSTGNFSVDPQFCDLPSGDFSLAPGSPCLPGNHPSGAPCGQIGAHGAGTCATSSPVVERATLTGSGPFAVPNPLRGAGTIQFETNRTGVASLVIYDVRGGRVRRLVSDRTLSAGRHEIGWDGRDDLGREVRSGVYFCRLEGTASQRVGRFVLRR